MSLHIKMGDDGEPCVVNVCDFCGEPAKDGEYLVCSEATGWPVHMCGGCVRVAARFLGEEEDG